MVLSIARQSVVIKCLLEKSVMVGNYEFYYGAGLLSKLSGVSIEAGREPSELKEAVMKIIEEYQGKDSREKYLMKLLRFYNPAEEKDGQMDELFFMGIQEERLWQE